MQEFVDPLYKDHDGSDAIHPLLVLTQAVDKLHSLYFLHLPRQSPHAIREGNLIDC